MADLCKALRTDSTFGSGGDESERDVSIVIKVIGVVRRDTRAPRLPANTHISQAASVYMVCDDDEFYDTKTDELVGRKIFVIYKIVR